MPLAQPNALEVFQAFKETIVFLWLYTGVSDDTERPCASTIQAMLRCFAYYRNTSGDKDTVGSEEVTLPDR